MVPTWLWVLLYFSAFVSMLLCMYAFGLVFGKVKVLLGMSPGVDARAFLSVLFFGPACVVVSILPGCYVYHCLSRVEYSAWLRTFDEPDARHDGKTPRYSAKLLMRSLRQWLFHMREKFFPSGFESEELPEAIYLE